MSKINEEVIFTLGENPNIVLGKILNITAKEKSNFYLILSAGSYAYFCKLFDNSFSLTDDENSTKNLCQNAYDLRCVGVIAGMRAYVDSSLNFNDCVIRIVEI